MNLVRVGFGVTKGKKYAVRRMLQRFLERMRRAIERPADETHAKLAACDEPKLFGQVRLAAERSGVSAAQDSEAACIGDRSHQAPARDQRHRRTQDRMANSELLGQPRLHNCRPFPKSRRRARSQTGMTWGPPEGRISFGSVRDCT